MRTSGEPDRREGLVVLAVDDEQPALAELAHLLGCDGRVRDVVTTRNAADALGVPSRAFDAVFLDIRMPGMSGVELAEAFAALDSAPPVVFVTADDSRAVAAFDVGAVDYLLKPLRPDHVTRSLDRVLGHAVGVRRDDVIPVELGGVTTLVRRSAVRYVAAGGDYVRLHTATGSHLVRMSLTTLAERWEPAGFVRVHRSYLVALAHVTEVARDGGLRTVRVGDGPGAVELPVSRRAFRTLKETLRDPWRADT